MTTDGEKKSKHCLTVIEWKKDTNNNSIKSVGHHFKGKKRWWGKKTKKGKKGSNECVAEDTRIIYLSS